MSKLQGARARAHGEVAVAIKNEARHQLAEEGAAKLSLRAVARKLGMVSSALYRYFPNRDSLLTALIIDAYDAVGAEAERALKRSESQGDSHVARWQEICRAVRKWALGNPHEYALIYGSPVPGYTAPESTTGPAARVGLAMLAVLKDAQAEGVLLETAAGEATAGELQGDAARLLEGLGVELPATSGVEMVAAWAQLFGLVSFELFGQFENVIGSRDAFFEHAVVGLARSVGLVERSAE
ncbi:TetR/AcrR family transcriptional regulator [Streptomyces sp. ODS28]|uniref:TetR/AcrR family transcriptional regulator n=1 Tax=Streptomyces sp. ODS28 TaxID=3136688 RepID=UPI0031E746C4